MKLANVLVVAAATVMLSASVNAAGWKRGDVARLGTNGYADNNQGQCTIWFAPAAGSDLSAECYGDGTINYVTFDCSATSGPTTGLTRNSAKLNFEQAQIAALTSNTIDLYIEDVQVNGFCVASQTSLIFSTPAP